MSEIETKLSAARTRLILDKPFLGALVLRLPMLEADPAWCHTTATDARAFYYNAEFIDALTLEQTQFVLAHEALHCALSHFARRLHRDKYRWDIACDLAINPMLIEEQLEPCPGALHLVEFEGMTAEEIYPCIDESDQMNTHDQHIYDQGDNHSGGTPSGGGDQPNEQTAPENSETPPAPPTPSKPATQSKTEPVAKRANQPAPLSPSEQEKLAIQWTQSLAGAYQQAIQAGKLGGELERMIGHLLQPRIPWRRLLAKYMTATAREDYNWSRPSRREGDAILPSLRSNELKVVIGLDTSGSISDEEMRQFVSEINAIKGQANARITLLACDAVLADDGPWIVEPWEQLQLPREFKGGGDTDFRPVFEWVERHDSACDLLIYFTDAQGDFPNQEPAMPVIWLIKGKADTPWGQRIQLN
ncbi:vWA domain-containing protein [Sedimenticola sp.]|uniref:vWA domain-containing protein n=1 Tax=Sedimenticola sp. TaxID=1940285 RepID=UPI003D11EB29